MGALNAPQLQASHVVFDDCKLDQAWFRASSLDHVRFDGCDLTEADFYRATITDSLMVRCRLAGAELSQSTIDDLVLNGSRLEGLKGLDALRNAVVGSDQVVELAAAVLAARNVRVDDEILDAERG